MANDDQQYEQACQQIRQDNTQLLTKFGKWLSKAGLSEKTLKQHLSNIDFYINEFLLYEEAIEASQGSAHISMFLSYWFIKKAAWSSASSIRANAASLKKFYNFMLEQGLVSQQAVNEMQETIREEMPEWIDTLQRYDDPSITDPGDIWGL